VKQIDGSGETWRLLIFWWFKIEADTGLKEILW